jgi:hypothetical protein
MRKPSISRAIILILSGFLIGLSSANYVRADLHDHVLTCGVVGLIAFVGLHFAARRREEEAAQQQLEEETQRVRELMAQDLANLQQSLHVKFKEIVHEARLQTRSRPSPSMDRCEDHQASPVDR